MTIAVFDGRTIAADRSAFKAGFAVSSTTKLYEFKTGNFDLYFVGSGLLTDVDTVKDFLSGRNEHFFKDLFEFDGTSVDIGATYVDKLSDTVDCMLVIAKDVFPEDSSHNREVRVFQLNNSSRAIVAPMQYTIGSSEAQLAARAAMMAGADAVEALKIACDLTLISKVEYRDKSTYDAIHVVT